MPIAAAIPAIIGVVGAAGGAAASLAGSSKQANAADQAGQLQYKLGEDSLNFQKQQWEQQQVNAQPWVGAGTQAIMNLQGLVGKPGEGLLTPWTDTFKAPTADEARLTPGYQFALSQGIQASDRGAAARGTVLGGGQLKALTQYGQGLADTNYNTTYGQKLNEYLQRYNEFNNNQTNEYNRLAGVAGAGQQATTNLGQLGQQAAGNVTNINSSTGAQVGNSYENAANATASGYAGAANALNSGIGNFQNYTLLQQILKNGTGGTPPFICWVAAELYGGWDSPYVSIVRGWMYRHPVALAIYCKIGEWLAGVIRHNLSLRRIVKAAFDCIVEVETCR